MKANTGNDVCKFTCLFILKYKSAYNKAFPLDSKKKGSKPIYKHPWMTQGLLKSSRKKSRLYLKYQKNPNPVNKNTFVTYRNKFKMIRINAKKITMLLNFPNIPMT